MSGGFPHPSRPGHHGLELTGALREYLGKLATAMFPGDQDYPSGAQAHVVEFIAARASATDVTTLTRLAEDRPAQAGSGDEVLARLEKEDPEGFAYLRELMTHAYYSSHRVLATLADRGYAYHGAPQPIGYAAGPTPLRTPSAARGSHLTTEELRRGNA